MLHTEINQIFRHTSYYKDKVLSESSLFQLNIIAEQIEQFSRKHALPTGKIPLRERAEILRAFLSRKVETLSPENSGGEAPDHDTRLIEYLILRKGYIDKLSRDEVILEINKLVGVKLSSNGRAYAQHLSRARDRLADQILLDEYAYIDGKRVQ